ncbi:hypothetical protein E2L00_07470 [Cedecea colo]|uniref:Uncharacterized protein n=1 Tax=Cedecea colo TaxID=2552946 RepID=A0ABX0VK10_9ENTR|nr:hypothetical protein [Cedecea colo]
MKVALNAPACLLTNKEKTWFYLVYDYQSKINELIFQFIFRVIFFRTSQAMRFVITLSGA